MSSLRSANVDLTVVGVVSIEADPEVVAVGNSNISYTIITQPAGYNYMVEYEPADTSAPGIKEVIAACGSSAATCTVTVVGFSDGTLSVEGGGDMRFYTSILGDDTILNAETDNPPFPGAYFDGTGTSVPEGVLINWQLFFKQYYTRTKTATWADGAVATEVEQGWDTGEDGSVIYASDNFSITGTEALYSNDSPSQGFNITSMYNAGVRSGSFKDEFNLYLYGQVQSHVKQLAIFDWGWSFAFTLFTNATGEVEYTITSRDEIP